MTSDLLPPRRGALATLASRTLPERESRELARLHAHSEGPAAWRARKRVEAHALFALAQVTRRVRLAALDLRDELKALVHLQVTVPTLVVDGAHERLAVGGIALLALRWPREMLTNPQKVPDLVVAQMPASIWLANVRPIPPHLVCLGPSLPSGIGVADVLWLAYRAFTMQDHMLDERDAAGVHNPDAARWWQANAARLPLSKEPFLTGEAAP